MRVLRFASVLLAALLAVGSIPALAHESGNHGTIKVHDDVTEDPPQQNDPQVSCDFWIEGFGMSDDSGHLVFSQIPPTANPETDVLSQNWTSDHPDEPQGFHFLSGPFNFTTSPGLGHYRVLAYVDEGHPGNTEHFAKNKVFWVEPCGGEVPPPPPCPTGLAAVANPNGTVSLTWDAQSGVDGFDVFRSVDGGSFDLLVTLGPSATGYLDTTTSPGSTFSYTVRPFADGVEADQCGVVEVRAVPDFPIVAGAGIAAAGVAAYLIRRRD
jgi:hypothetical protein